MANIDTSRNIKFEINIFCYNQSDFILDTFKTAVNQTLKPYRISFFDDCSTDNTFEIIEQYVKENNIENVYLQKNEHNLGIFRNFNQMIDHATGEVIMVLSGDDQLELDALEKYQKYIYDNKDNLSDDFWLIPNIKEVSPDGEEFLMDYSHIYQNKIFEAVLAQKLRSFEEGLSLSAYKKSKIRTDLGYQADNLKALSVIPLFDTRLVDICAYKYRLDVGVTVASKRNTYLKTRIDSLSKLITDYSERLTDRQYKLTVFEISFAEFRLNKSFRNYRNLGKSIFDVLHYSDKMYSNLTLIKWLAGGLLLCLNNKIK